MRDFAQSKGRTVAGSVADLPASNLTWHDATSYFEKVAPQFNNKNMRIGLPTELEWEAAVRGRPSDVRRLMSEEGLKVDDVDGLRELMVGRLENLFELPKSEEIIEGVRILTDPKHSGVLKALKGRNDVFAWHVYPTPTGAFPTKFTKGQVPVGSGRASSVGTHNMGMNGEEWCLDAYHPDAYSQGTLFEPVIPTTIPNGFPELYRVVRSGSIDSPRLILTAAYRVQLQPHNVYPNLGFRLAAHTVRS